MPIRRRPPGADGPEDQHGVTEPNRHRGAVRTAWALASRGDFAILVRKLLRVRPLLDESLAPQPRRRGQERLSAPRQKPVIWMGAPSLALDGAPLSQSEIAIGLAKRGHQIRIIAAMDGPLRAAYVAAGIPVSIVETLQASPSVPKWYDADVQALSELVLKDSPDLIVASTIDGFSLVDAAWVAGVTSVWNIRESEPWRERLADRHPYIASRALACLSYAERLIFVAEASRAGWGRFTSKERQTVIFNAAEPASDFEMGLGRQRARSAIGIEDDEVLLASVGTLCARKSQLDLADALNNVAPKTLTKVKVIFVGRSIGGYEQRVRDRLSESVRLRCQFLGERSDATALIAAADILINTSVSEAFPRTFLEAAARRTAILASDIDGASERLRHNHSAILFPPGDYQSLAKQIEVLCASPDKRMVLTQNAFDDLISRWSRQDMISAYERVFTSAIREAERQS